MLFLINPLFLISFWQQKRVERHTAPRTEVIGWDMYESPSVNILLMTKLLSLNPLSWDMDCLLTLGPLLIPVPLVTVAVCLVFWSLSLSKEIPCITAYIYSQKHQKSTFAPPETWVPVSFSLSLSDRRPWTTRFRSIKGPQHSTIFFILFHYLE